MTEGGAQFAQGNYEAAYVAYQKAWELKPHCAVAANMAATEIRLGRYLQAAAHLKYALNHLPLVQLGKRDAVEEQLEKVREHLVAVSLSANLDGVEISIDGHRLGRTPLPEEILLEPGHHAISAVYSDTTQTKAIDVSAGAHVSLVFELNGTQKTESQGGLASQSPQLTLDQAAAKSNRTRNWVLVGGAAATAISFGVGIALRIQSSNERDDTRTLQAQINSTATAPSQTTAEICANQVQIDACNLFQRSRAAADRDRNLSTGAFVAAGAFGLGTLTTALLWPSKSARQQPSTNGARELRFATWTANRGYGIQATIHF